MGVDKSVEDWDDNQKKQELNQAFQDWAKAEQASYENNARVLEQVKSQVSKDLFEDIEFYLGECDNTYDYNIVTEAPDDKYLQDESGSYDFLKEAWVDQYCNGGYVGDEFSGQVWIKISETEWFRFHYSM